VLAPGKVDDWTDTVPLFPNSSDNATERMDLITPERNTYQRLNRQGDFEGGVNYVLRLVRETDTIPSLLTFSNSLRSSSFALRSTMRYTTLFLRNSNCSDNWTCVYYFKWYTRISPASSLLWKRTARAPTLHLHTLNA